MILDWAPLSQPQAAPFVQGGVPLAYLQGLPYEQVMAAPPGHLLPPEELQALHHHHMHAMFLRQQEHEVNTPPSPHKPPSTRTTPFTPPLHPCVYVTVRLSRCEKKHEVNTPPPINPRQQNHALFAHPLFTRGLQYCSIISLWKEARGKYRSPHKAPSTRTTP